jgi:hypothetical protein
MAPFAHVTTDVHLPANNIPVISFKQVEAPSEVVEVVVEAKIDEDWLIGFVPNGGKEFSHQFVSNPDWKRYHYGKIIGYLLGLILQVCNLVQAETNLVHPIYMSSQFLGSSTVGLCSIVVRRIKPGKNFTNLTAELCQQVCMHC